MTSPSRCLTSSTQEEEGKVWVWPQEQLSHLLYQKTPPRLDSHRVRDLLSQGFLESPGGFWGNGLEGSKPA